ncbi:hypothetical protein SBA1_530065 [Candidatus Sulfotelmatobacter kueseliae]|uniref:Uncharacterized protein n=1 Tax=Candidatus Sulfotelmatobacter kueseliae TaxID=2042962 RepID=A0A2U3KXZ3_9BACT|nr:hypothetical protein SBA1_530065 [Candidatus Sulfotelmatobacter kueseliae]
MRYDEEVISRPGHSGETNVVAELEGTPGGYLREPERVEGTDEVRSRAFTVYIAHDKPTVRGDQLAGLGENDKGSGSGLAAAQGGSDYDHACRNPPGAHFLILPFSFQWTRTNPARTSLTPALL